MNLKDLIAKATPGEMSADLRRILCERIAGMK